MTDECKRLALHKEAPGGSRPFWEEIFAARAEQRARLSAGCFLRTHLPLELEGENGIVLEEALVRQVLDESTCPPGNRVWVVAGARGAGKSELLAWLDLTLAQLAPVRHRFLLHLHQHEADPLRFAQRLASLLPGGIEEPEVRLRWNEVERKPASVAKILLLLALDQLTQSDEEAYPLYYGLSDLVEAHLRRFIEGTSGGQPMSALALIGQEVWEAFREETALPVPFSYDAFHQALQAALHSYLFSGLSLSTLMRSIAEALREQSVRPVLLVDDLIGSLHLFAPDTLATLLSTPGTWDVVCGVSPWKESERQAAFLDRLTASSGLQGTYRLAPLNEVQCLNLARAYLLEYRRLSNVEGEAFFPFNQQTLLRLWRGLPDHRRTPGAFLRHLKLVLAQEGEEAFLAHLSRLAVPEYAARTADIRLARLAELYGPPLVPVQPPSIRLSPQPFFRWPEHEVVLPVEPLLSPSGERDEHKLAVFEWMREHEAGSTKELIELRKGAARLLQDTLAPEVLGVPPGCQQSLLRWRQTYKGIAPPILLAREWRSSQVRGIVLDCTIADLAFDLARYATASPTTRRYLAAYLRNEPQLASFFHAARQYQETMQQELEQQLAMPLERYALVLLLWSMVLGAPVSTPVVIATAQRLQLFALAPLEVPVPQPACATEWQQFFLDTFALPEGGLDEERLRSQCAALEQDALTHLLSVDAAHIGMSFRWRGRPLRVALQAWQRMISARFVQAPDNGQSTGS